MKKRVKIFLSAAILMIAAGILYLIINRLTGFAIPCFFYRTTGFCCPGCGVSRMLINIARLDFAAAFNCNRLLFVTSPLIIYLIAKMSVGYIKNGSVKLNKADNIIVYLLIAAFVIFGVVRNIPEFSYLRPH